MRTFLVLLLAIVLPLSAADRATIYGTLLTPDGSPLRTSVLFEPKSTPGALGTNVVVNYTVLARTGSDGYFTTNLVAGNYRVTVKGVAPWPDSTFYALVPSGTGSYSLSSITTNAITASPSAWYVLLSTVTNKGDIYVATASGTVTRLGAGSSNEVLTVDPSSSTGLKWATPPAGSSTNGGTVTSVGVTGGTGISVYGSPITSSGTIALTLNSNLVGWAAIPTNSLTSGGGSTNGFISLVDATNVTSGMMQASNLVTQTQLANGTNSVGNALLSYSNTVSTLLANGTNSALAQATNLVNSASNSIAATIYPLNSGIGNVDTNDVATRDWVQGQGYGSGGASITNTFNTGQFTVTGSGSVSNVAIASGANVTNLNTFGSTNQGHMLFSADNTYSIGGSATTLRPANIWAANTIKAGNVTFMDANQFGFDSGPVWKRTGAGGYWYNNSGLGLTLQYATTTNSGILSFGGSSSLTPDAYHVILTGTNGALRVTHGADPNGTNQAGGIVINPIANTNRFYGTSYIDNPVLSGTAGTSSQFWRGDGVWATPTGGSGATNAISTVQSNGTDKVTGAVTMNLIGAGINSISVVSNAGGIATVTVTGTQTNDTSKLPLSGGTITGGLIMGSGSTITLPSSNAAPANGRMWYNSGDSHIYWGNDDATPSTYMKVVAYQDGAYQSTNANLTGLVANETTVASASAIHITGTNLCFNFTTGNKVYNWQMTNDMMFVYSTNSTASSTVENQFNCRVWNDTATAYAINFNTSWRRLGNSITNLGSGKVAVISAFITRGTAETNCVYAVVQQN